MDRLNPIGFLGLDILGPTLKEVENRWLIWFLHQLIRIR